MEEATLVLFVPVRNGYIAYKVDKSDPDGIDPRRAVVFSTTEHVSAHRVIDRLNGEE